MVLVCFHIILGLLASVHGQFSEKILTPHLFPSRMFTSADTHSKMTLVWETVASLLTPLQGNVSDQCLQDGRAYINQLNKLNTFMPGEGWALKMFDASAKTIPSSFLQGNLRWMGNYDSCLEAKAPNFRGKHCILGFYPPGSMPGLWQPEGGHGNLSEADAGIDHLVNLMGERAGDDFIISLLSLWKIGRCIPSSCSEDDVHNGFSAAWEDAVPRTGLEVYADNCNSHEDSIELSAADWVMIVIVCAFGVVVTVSTCADLAGKVVKLKTRGWMTNLRGFSAYSNTVKIFSTANNSKDSLTCITGIRFLSMSWVLVSHSYSQFSQSLPVSNPLYIFDGKGPIFGNLAFQSILNGFPSVDTFFFIGATLLSYITLRELEKKKGGNLSFWLMYYIHRYIRLTGVYALIIGISATLLKYFAHGPYSLLVKSEIDGCQRDWWTNLLYINNLKWVAEPLPMCMVVTWYLANDMQFYLISPLIIYPLWRRPLFGVAAGFLWLVAATVTPMIIVYVHDYPLSISFMTPDNFAYFTDVYIVPWCRFQPYIAGILFGWLLHKHRHQSKLSITPFISIWIWATAGAIGAAVVYGLYPYQLEFSDSSQSALVGSAAVRILYNGLHRLAWPMCLGWLIWACVKGGGGPINGILSWHAWIPLARLSYCIYLIHYTLMAYICSLPSFSVNFSHALAVYWVLALLVLSIFLAYLAVILFEAPIVALEKIIFQSMLTPNKIEKAAKSPVIQDQKEKCVD